MKLSHFLCDLVVTAPETPRIFGVARSLVVPSNNSAPFFAPQVTAMKRRAHLMPRLPPSRLYETGHFHIENLSVGKLNRHAHETPLLCRWISS